MDSTSTCHCSNLKFRFEELSYKFCLIRKSAHSTTAFLRLSMSMADPIAIGVETLRIDSGCSLEKEFTELIRMNP